VGRCEDGRVVACREGERLSPQRDAPRPALPVNRRLTAPEHVLALQRSAGNRNVVRALQRQPATRERARRPAATAASAPRLDVRQSVNGPACACLVFIHNNERNARLTAQLLHRHCRYNLVIAEPDNGQRRIRLPGASGTVDPNELFPPDVIEQCVDDPQPCRDFVAANSASTDARVIRQVVERQFFLAVFDGSDGFRLPLIALHNNTVDDTAAFRAAAPNTAGVRGRTFGQAPDTDRGGTVRPLQELQDWLRANVGADARTAMTGRRGTTNIFRWCVSPDVSRCHVGDPDRPDTVVWVTNEADFRALSAQPINVVLQSAASASGESATDLSTLFLTARDVINRRADEQIQQHQRAAQGADLWGALGHAGEAILVDFERAARLSQLRYINIETPGSPIRSGQTAAQLREESFDSILATLRAAGLDCCSRDAGAGEAAVREGLRRGTLEAPAAR
jgi:hypothetical protein